MIETLKLLTITNSSRCIGIESTEIIKAVIDISNSELEKDAVGSLADPLGIDVAGLGGADDASADHCDHLKVGSLSLGVRRRHAKPGGQAASEGYQCSSGERHVSHVSVVRHWPVAG